MIISDLNYLESADSSAIVGSGGTNFNTNIKKNVDIKENIQIWINKDVNSYVNIKGNLATGQASADAFGENTLAETNVFVQSTDYSSESYSSGVAGTGYSYYYH